MLSHRFRGGGLLKIGAEPGHKPRLSKSKGIVPPVPQACVGNVAQPGQAASGWGLWGHGPTGSWASMGAEAL